MADLTINFAGIKAPNPFWLASGPPSNSAGQVLRAFEKGWGGAVWKTIGASVTNVYSRYAGLDYHSRRLAGMTNIELISDRSVAENLRDIELVKKHYPERPVIVSLMTQSREDWQQLVKDAENAGADGLELNFSCPHGMSARGMGAAVGQEPQLVELLTRWVMEVASAPVLVKLTPNITDITEPARAAKQGGADALAMINTIQSIAGVDIDHFVPYPVVGTQSTSGGFSGPAVKPVALNMIKNCALDPGLGLPISGIGGIETWRDTVEFILLGAGSLQICTAVMHHGFGIIDNLISGIEKYMSEKGFGRISEFTGKALHNTTSWGNLNLNNRVVAHINSVRCNACHVCYTACNDGAYQAITIPEKSADKKPLIVAEKCTGCNLCSLVCPSNGITMINISREEEELTWNQLTANQIL